MKQSWFSFVKLGSLAGVVAAVINAALFFVGSYTGAIPSNLIIPNAGQPLTIVPVLVSSFLPAVVAGLLLDLLNRFTKRPLRIFTIIVLAILAFSFISPFSIPGIPITMIVILKLMHMVVVGAVLLAFNRFVNREG